MSKNTYQELNEIRKQRVKEVKAEPRLLQGSMMPTTAANWAETPMDRDLLGGQIWMKIALATMINLTEAIGWEKYLNLIDSEQRKSKDKGYKGAKNLIKQYNILGDNVMSAVSTMVSHAMGAGFYHHMHTLISEKLIEAFGGWCPMVEAVRDMGFSHKPEAQDVPLFCDGFDDLNTQIVNPNIWMTHSHCPLRGDKYCRFYIQELDGPPQGDNYYQKVKGINDQKRKEVEEKMPEPDYFQGITPPRFMEKLTPEYIAADGVLSWGRIAQETITLAANAIGWEKFINLVASEQSWGYEQLALKMRAEHNIQENRLRSAGIAVAYNYLTLGFENHHIIEFTDERVEGIGHECPIVESAKRMEMEDKIEDMSLWCDCFHNHAVHAVNSKFQLTHTHCLGRGDKYCRFVIK